MMMHPKAMGDWSRHFARREQQQRRESRLAWAGSALILGFYLLAAAGVL